jgi:hypothetical protein
MTVAVADHVELQNRDIQFRAAVVLFSTSQDFLHSNQAWVFQTVANEHATTSTVTTI